MENLALLFLETNNVDLYSWVGWILFGAFALACLVVLFFVWWFHYNWWLDRRERRRAVASGKSVKSLDERFVDAFGDAPDDEEDDGPVENRPDCF
jgi:hypothetical protein